MADYNDYLAYLHHIDDTTAQEFKKKEDELRHQIDVVRDQCQKEIRNHKAETEAERTKLEADHKSFIEDLVAKNKDSVDKLTSEITHLKNVHKTEIEKQKNEYKSNLASAEQKRVSEVNTLKKNIEFLKTSSLSEIERLKSQITHIYESTKKEYQSLQLESEKNMARTRANYEDNLRKQKEEKERELENLMFKYEALLKQKDYATSTLIEKHNQELADLRRKYDKRIEEISRELEKMQEKTPASYEDELRRLRLEKEQLSALIEKHNQEFADLKCEHDKNVEEVNKQWEKKLFVESQRVNSSNATYVKKNRTLLFLSIFLAIVLCVFAGLAFVYYDKYLSSKKNIEKQDTLIIDNDIDSERISGNLQLDVDSVTIVLTKGHASKRNFLYSGKVDSDGLPDGHGKANYPETKSSKACTFEGTFNHGITSEGVMRFDNGNKYEGTFTDDGFFKEGTWTETDGYYFVGTFKNGDPYNGNWYTPKGNVDSKVTNGK